MQHRRMCAAITASALLSSFVTPAYAFQADAPTTPAAVPAAPESATPATPENSPVVTPAAPADAAPAAATVTPQPAAGQVTIQERTEIRVRLKKELKSGKSKTGEEVPFEVTQDIYSPNRTLLVAAGTPAYGKVTESKRRGMFGKAGKLQFTCDYVRLQDGTKIPLRSDPMGSKGKSNTGAVIATALFLSVLGVFVNGRDVTVKEGQEFPMYVDDNTTYTSPLVLAGVIPAVPVAAAAPAAAVAPGKSLFLLKDGKEVVGTLLSFDGKAYTVATDKGSETIAADTVKSVFALK